MIKVLIETSNNNEHFICLDFRMIIYNLNLTKSPVATIENETILHVNFMIFTLIELTQNKILLFQAMLEKVSK